MRRRSVLGILSGAALLPVATYGQKRAMPLLGFLGVSSLADQQPRVDAFVRRMRELGWFENKTILFEYRWAEGRSERYSEIAAEFAKLKVDLIVTAGAGPVLAVKRAAPEIPVVFAIATDPVATGIVSSLAHPGGNATGLSYLGPDLAGKRVQLSREVIPGLSRLGIMANRLAPGPMLELQDVENAAIKIGIAATLFKIVALDDIEAVFTSFKDRCDALYVCSDPLVNAGRFRIVSQGLAASVPTVFGERDSVSAGGLFSYGPNVPDMYRRAADLVDKILRGTKPGEIPVEQPTKIEFVINLKTAKAIGLDVSPIILARADEVIE
ncbi:ABC transporter substrate-binding protein [Bradyrhizobium sp. CCBAU 51745]|uniref:ABC transporter substrate-binding protein n=1 Tax=Bradyrhizobium sp. CCBAU 51745 TaxID=1325099 RepID=UPI002306DBAC|nr:ABC transporter substrate-binding protein [Bradyrhizobium sp. CCBAU 51745]